MESPFITGIIATSSLIIGGIIASRFKFGNRLLGIILGFGAGTLIAAVSYELVFEAIKLAKGTGFPAFGFFSGALVFLLCDLLIEKLGAKNHMQVNAAHSSGLIVPMVLAIILDGIPESIVIGLGMFETGEVSLAMLVAVFISNIPESIAGTTGMRAGGWKRSRILLLWTGIAFICALSTMAGFWLFRSADATWLSFIQAFAGGAILVMLSNSMMPEAFEHGKRAAGIFTVLGFAVSVCMVIIEAA